MKPRIAVFSLTGCEGCSLAILELENELLDVLEAVEVVNFREAMTERAWDIDIGFVDGAVSTPGDEQEVRHFREKCGALVALGACAGMGGINTLKNHQSSEDYRRYVYGDRYSWFPTTDARPVSAVVKVDYELPGCPIDRSEFLRFVKWALAGRRFRLPDYPVCVECKRLGNLCLYEKGIMCLGPLTRAGCNAICPSFGAKCEGCRGILHDESLKAAAINFQDQHEIAIADVLHDLRLFGAYQGIALS
jgi:coenzyme F420-reducing hydrogenase gamma subunit